MHFRFSVCISILLLTAATLTHAAPSKLTQGDYKNRADVEAFIDKMAAKNIYSQQELIDLFSNVKQQKRLFKKMNNAAEHKLTWDRYRRIFITEKRINRGVAFYKKHQALLDTVSEQYQVPQEIIVAIIGVETFYGRIKGNDPVFDTLVTFAFDFPKRAKFFTSELEHFLSLTKEHNVDVRKATGSYAGAMGMPQFISSSYRHYAVDFDGDKKIDLWDNKADIFASIANYFKRHGWRPNEAVALPITTNNAQAAPLSTKLKPSHSYNDFKAKGLHLSANTLKKHQIHDQTKLSMINLEQKNSHDYWAGLPNFYVITRYNHSSLYAMAVYQLSQKIKQKL